MTEPSEPGVLQRLRARYAWFDHVLRAQERYTEARGNHFAAGITYFTVFALFPLLMVGFSIGGFVLAGRPDLLRQIEDRIRTTVSGDASQQLIELMDSAIASRTSVGLIGLATATWAGLSWMANLREALSEMWEQRPEKGNFVRTKLSDLVALLSLFLALLVTFGLTALGDRAVMRGVLRRLEISEFPGLGIGLKVASIAVAMLVAWLLFTWVIARLPRTTVSLRSSVRAGLLAAIGFEIFKQVGSVYLASVTTGPAGATFGPVLGLMVFAYITSRLILFATAWAATSADSLTARPVEPPVGARITTRIQVREGVGVVGTLTAAAIGALGALGLSRWLRH